MSKVAVNLCAAVLKPILKARQFFGNTSLFSENEILHLANTYTELTASESQKFERSDAFSDAELFGAACLCAWAVGRASQQDFETYLERFQQFLSKDTVTRVRDKEKDYSYLYSVAIFSGNCAAERLIRQRFFVNEPYLSAGNFQMLLVDSEAFKEPLSAIGQARLTMLRELLIQLPEVQRFFKRLIFVFREDPALDETLSSAEKRAGRKTMPKLFESFTDGDLRRAFTDPAFFADVWLFSKTSEEDSEQLLASLYGKEPSLQHTYALETLAEAVEKRLPITGAELKKFLDQQDVPPTAQLPYLRSETCRAAAQSGIVIDLAQLDALLTARGVAKLENRRRL